jgi:hypothetical protein
LEQAVLAKSNNLAERNRAWLAERRIMALNLVSAPGAGKTTLLERTLRDLGHKFPMYVIEGTRRPTMIPSASGRSAAVWYRSTPESDVTSTQPW